MEVDTVAGHLSDEASRGHERPEEPAVFGGEAKKPRGGDEDKDNGVGNHEEDMDDDEVDWWDDGIHFLDYYRQEWVRDYGKFGSFEDETSIKAKQLTDGPVLPINAWPRDMLQIFSVKVTEIMGGLQWPLDVYGHVAVRDSLDHKRIYLFRRGREDCQTLASSKDSSLKLTGPSRAVVLMDPVLFEVDLKVKTNVTPFKCEDKVLSYHAFFYNNIAHMSYAGVARRNVESTEHSTLEFVFAHLKHAVEATIEVRVIEGSTDFMARFIARTAGIDEDFVLLDSLDRKVVVTDDGVVRFQRCVVAVEDKEQRMGLLTLQVEAKDGGDSRSMVKKVGFRPRVALRSQGIIKLGFCELLVEVAWSMLK